MDNTEQEFLKELDDKLWRPPTSCAPTWMPGSETINQQLEQTSFEVVEVSSD